MSYKIVIDSCGELPESWKTDENIESIPLTLTVEGEDIIDDETFDQSAFLKKTAQSPECPKSSCPSPERYMQAYDCSAERVYAVTLSSNLSGSYNSAVQARDIYLEEHPEKKIHVFNSHSASAGQSALLIKLFELCRAGLPFEQVIEEMDHFIAHLTTLFVLENLDNLRKNGRLSEVQALITGTLHIKLVMEGTPAGTIRKVSQALSVKQALARLADAAAEKAKKHGIEGRTLVISHCNCPDRAVYVRNLLFKKLPFTQVEMVRTGGISTVYAGDGGVVVAF